MVRRSLYILALAAALGIAIHDHLRLRAIDAYLSAIVGTRTTEAGVAPLNRADGLAVLLHEALQHAAAQK